MEEEYYGKKVLDEFYLGYCKPFPFFWRLEYYSSIFLLNEVSFKILRLLLLHGFPFYSDKAEVG